MQYRVQVNDYEKEGNYIKGMVNVTFGDAIKVTGIKIGLGRDDSLFIGMPNYKGKDEEYKDICNPIDKEFRAELYGHIFDTFDSLHDGKGNVLIFNADSKEKITPAVRVTPVKNGKNGVQGLATIVLNDKFALNNITIRQVGEKQYVDFPAYRTNKIGENEKPIYQNICYPVTKKWQEKIRDMVLKGYQEALEKEKEVSPIGLEKDPDRSKKNGKARTA